MEKRIVFPDYSNSLVNLSSSILKAFGVETKEPSLRIVDNILKKDYKNIVLLLLDGMGVSIMEKTLDKRGAFWSNLLLKYTSVFPATTVAATTSVLSSLPPISHAWLGWDNYYPEVGENVTVFLNKVQGTTRDAASYFVASKYAPYKSIITKINEGGGKAFGSSPFIPPYPGTFDSVLDRVGMISKEKGRKFIYAYWTDPDGLLHESGTEDIVVRNELRTIEDKVSKLASSLSDTLFLVTADHGHIDADGVYINEYPEIMDTLLRLPSLEPRTPNFFIKEGRKEEFKERFLNRFSNDYVLLNRKEVIEKKLFGRENEHTLFKEMLGDYLGYSRSNKTLFFYGEKLKSMHGSMTEDEMVIPLIAFGI